ncbi:hypothetical protein F5Y16DRAFT_402769 [Xylariaceae sp. FL0255]|nr:hypothetical protein F5Y16DRAFT_402769 [Xylariaceae sp. FL0255]
MRFFQFIAAGAALASTVAAAAVDTKLVARDDSPFTDLGLSDSFWGTADNYCRNGIPSKRDLSRLEARDQSPPSGYNNVAPGTYRGDFGALNQNGDWTNFLVTCHGVVIIGENSNPINKDKYMAHFFATNAAMDDLWNTLSADVASQSLTNMQAWLSVPDSSSPPSGLNSADMLTVENKMIDLLQTLTGQAPTVRHHNAGDASAKKDQIGTMQLDFSNKAVSIDGNSVPFGSSE